MNMSSSTEIVEIEKPLISAATLLLILNGVAAGCFIAVILLPTWLPGLAVSFLGANPQAYWFLSRGSALVAYGALWFSMILGLLITNKVARIWPGGPKAYELHQFFSLLGLTFGLFHGLILLGDHYIGYNLIQIITPFASENYRPVWVGLGQIAFYLWGIIVISFYMRKKIGNHTWRYIHYASFITFLITLVHGITTGTDSANGGGIILYWFTGSTIFLLLIYRILITEHRANRTVLSHR
jgi:predicted ferric reductase